MLYRHVFSAVIYLISVMILLIATCTWTKGPKTNNNEVESFMVFTLTVICFMMGAIGCFQVVFCLFLSLSLTLTPYDNHFSEFPIWYGSGIPSKVHKRHCHWDQCRWSLLQFPVHFLHPWRQGKLLGQEWDPNCENLLWHLFCLRDSGYWNDLCLLEICKFLFL